MFAGQIEISQSSPVTAVKLVEEMAFKSEGENQCKSRAQGLERQQGQWRSICWKRIGRDWDEFSPIRTA